jgi:hypothetical protein
MTTDAALTLIIARCPQLVGQAAQALRALHVDSPIAGRRAAGVAGLALRQYGDQFDAAERAALAALLADDPGDVREVNLLIRVAPAERDRIHRDAAAAGETTSDYLRRLLGLQTRAERRQQEVR